jgi:hypothetical protein
LFKIRSIHLKMPRCLALMTLTSWEFPSMLERGLFRLSWLGSARDARVEWLVQLFHRYDDQWMKRRCRLMCP